MAESNSRPITNQPGAVYSLKDLASHFELTAAQFQT
jgi:hypothetical protein